MTADYAALPVEGVRGETVVTLDPKGPAARAGVELGDAVLDVEGQPVRDVLDWQWYTDADTVDVTVARGDERVILALRRGPGEAWGIGFADAIFDGVRTCRNNCSFCFMGQLPKGLRRSLSVRDDDFRLSFLNGNFITLTNLTEDDIERISTQRLSPLYVSVHAVDTDVRRELVSAREDHALERLDELLAAGVNVHVQIVLVPGVNDGEVLDHTLTWLAEREGIASVGVVPLGFTDHQDRFDHSYTDPLAAATVIQQVQRWQFAMKERDDISWVHLADEFYLNARAPLPSDEWYDGFPQYENGIGMVRSLVDEALALKEPIEHALASLPAERESVTIVTGVMAATTLAGALQGLGGVGRVRLLVVPNRFFGGNVSVTGLLTGRDVTAALERDETRGIYLLPDVIFNSDGLTLDDLKLEDIREQSGADVRLVSSDAAGLLEGLEQAAADLA